MDFKVGDIVKLCDVGPITNVWLPEEEMIGKVGVVINIDQRVFDCTILFENTGCQETDAHLLYVRFDEENRMWHNLNGSCEDKHGYFVFSPCAVVIGHKKLKNVINAVTCKNCGRVIPASKAVKSKDGFYVCKDCMEVKGYYTRNNNSIHTEKKHGKTYGFEFECVPRSKEDMASLLNGKYGLIPTHDGSLPSNGVEFKTPVIHSLNGFKSILRSMDKHANLGHSSCGQHVNIGDVNYLNSDNMEYVRRFKRSIFRPLEIYMKDNREDMTRVCGRYFTRYANYDCSFSDHSSWLNLAHNDRIEYRISKFMSVEQYFHLVCMWTEITDCLITSFIKKVNSGDVSSTKMKQYAQKTGTKMVNIFKKYAENKANCQSEKRNSVKATPTRKPRTKKSLTSEK